MGFSIKPTPLGYDPAKAAIYGPLGFAMASFASLECALDDFIIAFYGRFRDETLKRFRNYPRQFDEKIDFFVWTHLVFSPLRASGDGGGWLNLNSLGYMLEEVFTFRNHMVHGDLILTEREADRIVYRQSKFAFGAKSEQGRRVEETHYQYSTRYLDDLIETSRFLKVQVRNAQRVVAGENVAKQMDAVRRGRAQLRELECMMLSSASHE